MKVETEGRLQAQREVMDLCSMCECMHAKWDLKAVPNQAVANVAGASQRGVWGQGRVSRSVRQLGAFWRVYQQPRVHEVQLSQVMRRVPTGAVGGDAGDAAHVRQAGSGRVVA